MQIAQRVWEQPTLVAALKTGATAQDTIKADMPLVTSLPLGWQNGTPQNLPLAIIGWLITAFASVFGAPFWFDTLQRIVRLKGAGPSPDEKTDHTAASA